MLQVVLLDWICRFQAWLKRSHDKIFTMMMLQKKQFPAGLPSRLGEFFRITQISGYNDHEQCEYFLSKGDENMMHFRAFTVLVVLGCGKLSWAAYPTVWTMINTTAHKIYFECESHNVTPGRKVFTDTLVLEPNTTQIYTWYSFYNDGQGLNPADWYCETGDSVRSIRGETNFKTGLGEAVTLRIDLNQGVYHISKL